LHIRFDAEEDVRAPLIIIADLSATDEATLPEVGYPRIRQRCYAGYKAGPGQLPCGIKGVGRRRDPVKDRETYGSRIR
jgi:hypothetical protein